MISHRRGNGATATGAARPAQGRRGARWSGPSAMGPLAIAVSAVGALAIGRVVIANAVIRRLRAGEIEIGTLRVRELEVGGRRWPPDAQDPAAWPCPGAEPRPPSASSRVAKSCMPDELAVAPRATTW